MKSFQRRDHHPSISVTYWCAAPYGLDQIIQRWQDEYPDLLLVVELKVNRGLGIALQAGIEACSYGIVARADADDICLPTPFARQLSFLVANPTVDLVSCWVAAFEGNIHRVRFIRKVPVTHAEIERLAHFRFPVPHPACMFRRGAVIAAGGYKHRPGLEDYDLLVRMLVNGAQMASIPEVLYMLRWGPEYVGRRLGCHRAHMQFALQKHLLQMGFVSIPQFLWNILIRGGSCFMPLPVVDFSHS